MKLSDEFVSLADLFRAYRKAKADAFYDGMHFDAFAFVNYEKNLERNLRALLRRLRGRNWSADLRFLGGYSYAPKSLTQSEKWRTPQVHFSTLDHCTEWGAAFDANPLHRADAKFRLIIRASVNYQIVSALWILKVGHLFEAVLDSDCSYGNRLRRHRGSPFGAGRLNVDCAGLFVPYFGAYRAWRENGLNAMREELEAGKSIIAATMDVRAFYHNVSPCFLLRDEFHEFAGVALTEDQSALTRDLVDSIGHWYHETPDYAARPAGAIPVGLSASKVISNVLLAELDTRIRDDLSPAYYGRYVDDVFLVLRSDGELRNGEDFMRWLASRIPERLRFIQDNGKFCLKFEAPYAADSEIVFAGDKQKIFALSGRYGLDLVDHIEEQIKKQTSEYRLLPTLPERDGEMLSKALLATPDATLEADALRKADVVSVRRLGFSMILSDAETYARDLRPKEWARTRRVFYGLVLRHVLTPKGIFDYFAYINRVFGLMLACGDIKDAAALVARIAEVARLVKATSSAGTTEAEKFEHCMSLYARGLYQAALQATTVKGFRFTNTVVKTLRGLKSVSKRVVIATSTAGLKTASRDLLYADFGRRPYKEFWIAGENTIAKQPIVPRDRPVKKVLRLGAIRKFRQEFMSRELSRPYWPAVVFPTRPLTVPEITLVAPKLYRAPDEFESIVLALRGARVAGDLPPTFVSAADRPALQHLYVPAPYSGSQRVAVVSFESSDEQWRLALNGKPDRGLARYRRINRLINDVLRAHHSIDYIVLPEACIPRRWALSVAGKLAKVGVSVLAGLENNGSEGPFRNDALVSLATQWPGYRSHALYIQPKMAPAFHESRALRKAKRKFFKPLITEFARPVFAHGEHFFGLLICSDLTNIDNRRHFQGAVDSLFVLEWNQDVTYFGSLVESAALDLHAYVVQVNNRRFGDSRVRAPRVLDYERDVVRLKGGERDYFVLATLQTEELRRFQMKNTMKGFKPLPIGFRVSDFRKAQTSARLKRKRASRKAGAPQD